jgi:hypothetical protein
MTAMNRLDAFLDAIRSEDSTAAGTLCDFLEETGHPLAPRVRARYRRWEKARKALLEYMELMESEVGQRWRDSIDQVRGVGGRVHFPFIRRHVEDMGAEERHEDELLRAYLLRVLG